MGSSPRSPIRLPADSDLAVRDLSHLFPWETTLLAYRRDKYLRRFQQHFMELMQTLVKTQGVVAGESSKPDEEYL